MITTAKRYYMMGFLFIYFFFFFAGFEDFIVGKSCFKAKLIVIDRVKNKMADYGTSLFHG
jgi:hypothetical protein